MAVLGATAAIALCGTGVGCVISAAIVAGTVGYAVPPPSIRYTWKIDELTDGRWPQGMEINVRVMHG
ncbi:hypothetical protein M2302_004907 [Micromonospora sp. A200]|uniref:hypothetical protein n=1 Tax=Micromonospora sp. A200 TaxID=2940568 RepID=UPI002476CE92|nr:hypothetical protein [Micromonospora sp. A200]MDH6464706.1 hypothetical protein [Micromonospora sp. A200]